MIVSSRIALFYRAESLLSQTGFDFHHGFHVLGSSLFVLTDELEHLHDVRLVAFADVGSSLICIEVVFLFAEADTALVKLENVVLAIHDVGTHVVSKVCAASQVGHGLDDTRLVADSIDFVEFRLDRSHTVGIEFFSVHGEVVEVANLLSHRAFFVLLRSDFGNQAFQLLAVVFAQLVECAEA